MLRKSLMIVVVALLAACASAQMDMMGMARRMQSSPIVLLIMPDVKKELKLSGEQNKKIGAISKDFQQKSRDGMKTGDGRDLSATMNMAKAMEDLQEQAAKDAVAVLDADQAKRFAQIQLQVLGMTCLYDPEMQKSLGLSDEQVAKIKEVEDAEADSTGELFQGSHGNPKEMQKKLKEIHAKRDADLLKALTEAQASKLKELQGPPSPAAKKIAEIGL